MKIEHAGNTYEFPEDLSPQAMVSLIHEQNPESFKDFDQEALQKALVVGGEEVRKRRNAPTAGKAAAASMVGVVDKSGGAAIQAGMSIGSKLAEGTSKLVQGLASFWGGEGAGYYNPATEELNPAALTPQEQLTLEQTTEMAAGPEAKGTLGAISESLGATAEHIGEMNLEAAKQYDVPDKYRPQKFTDLKSPTKWVVGASELAAQIGETTAAGIGGTLVGGPAGGLAMTLATAFSFEFADGYSSARAMGKSHEEATNAGLLQGSVNAVPEALVPASLSGAFDFVKGRIVPKASASKAKKLYASLVNHLLDGDKLAVSALSEGTTEAVQELTGAWATGAELPSFDDYAIAFAFGAAGGSAVHIATHVLPSDSEKVPENLAADLKEIGEQNYLEAFLNKESVTYSDLAEFVDGAIERLAEAKGVSPDTFAGMYKIPALEESAREDFDFSEKDPKLRAKQLEQTDPILYGVLSQNTAKGGMFDKVTSGEWSLEQLYRTIFDISRGKSLDEDATLANGEKVYKVSGADRTLLLHHLWSGEGQLLHTLDMLAGAVNNKENMQKALPYDMTQAMYDSTAGYRLWAGKEEPTRPGARKQAELATQSAIYHVQEMLYSEAKSAGFETTAEYLAHKEAQGNPLRVEQISARVQETLSGRQALYSSYVMMDLMGGDLVSNKDWGVPYEDVGQLPGLKYPAQPFKFEIKEDKVVVRPTQERDLVGYGMKAGAPSEVAYVKKSALNPEIANQHEDPHTHPIDPIELNLEDVVIVDLSKGVATIDGKSRPWLPMAMLPEELKGKVLTDESGHAVVWGHGTRGMFNEIKSKPGFGAGDRWHGGELYLSSAWAEPRAYGKFSHGDPEWVTIAGVHTEGFDYDWETKAREVLHWFNAYREESQKLRLEDLQKGEHVPASVLQKLFKFEQDLGDPLFADALFVTENEMQYNQEGYNLYTFYVSNEGVLDVLDGKIKPEDATAILDSLIWNGLDVEAESFESILELDGSINYWNFLDWGYKALTKGQKHLGAKYNEVMVDAGFRSILHLENKWTTTANIAILDKTAVTPCAEVTVSGQKEVVVGQAAWELMQDEGGTKGTYVPPFAYGPSDAAHQINFIAGAADPTTLIHEFGHYLMHRLDPDSGTMQMLEEAVHLAIYKENAAAHPVKRFKDWSYSPSKKKKGTLHHEIAAELFETYMMFRQPPVGADSKVVAALAALRSEFRRIYKVAKKTRQIRPDVRDFMDHMFNGGFDVSLRPEQAISAMAQIEAIFGGSGEPVVDAAKAELDLSKASESAEFELGKGKVSMSFPDAAHRVLYGFGDMVKGASRKRKLEVTNYVAEIIGAIPQKKWNKKAQQLVKDATAASRKYRRLLRVEAGKRSRGQAEGGAAPRFNEKGPLKQENVKGSSIGKGTLPPYMVALLEDNDIFTGAPVEESKLSFATLNEVAARAIGDKKYVATLLEKAKECQGDGLTEAESVAIHLMFLHETQRCQKFMGKSTRYAKQQMEIYKRGIAQLESLTSRAAGRHLALRSYMARTVATTTDEMLKKKNLPKLVRKALRQLDENIYAVIQASGLAEAESLKEAILAIEKFPELKGWRARLFEVLGKQLEENDPEVVMTLKSAALVLQKDVVTKAVIEGYIVGNLLSNIGGRLRDIKDNTLMLGYMAYGRKFAEAMVDAVGATVFRRPREAYFKELLVNPFRLKHRLASGEDVSTMRHALRRTSEALKGESGYGGDKSRLAEFGANFGLIPNLMLQYGTKKEKVIGGSVGFFSNLIRSIDVFTRVVAEDVYLAQFQQKLEIWDKVGELDSRLEEIATNAADKRKFSDALAKQEYIEAVMREPQIAINDSVVDFMNFVTFQNESWLADAIRGVRDKADRSVYAATGIPFPFVKFLSGGWFIRTPINIIKHSLKVAPVWADPTFGAASIGLPMMEGYTRKQSRQEIARNIIINQIIGHMIALPIAMLYFAGKITGPPPKDEKERDYLTQQLGWKPFAFRFEFGDKVYYQTMPDSFAWGIKAIITRLSFLKNIEDYRDKSTGKLDQDLIAKDVLETSITVNKSLLYNTYFREMSDLTSNKVAGTPISRASGLLPYTGFFRWFATSWNTFHGEGTPYVDYEYSPGDGPQELIMKTLGAGYGSHIANALGQAIPGIEYEIPPQIGVFGKTISREQATYDIGIGKLPMEWFPMPVPFMERASEGRQLDAVELEWSRLGVYPGTIQQEQSIRGQKWELTIPETQQANMEYGYMLKEKLAEVIAKPSYQAASLETQQKIMSRLVQNCKKIALSSLLKDKAIRGRRDAAIRKANSRN